MYNYDAPLLTRQLSHHEVSALLLQQQPQQLDGSVQVGAGGDGGRDLGARLALELLLRGK